MGFSDKEVGWPIVTKLMQYCILHLYFSDLKCLYSLIKKSLVKCMPSKSFVMWNGFQIKVLLTLLLQWPVVLYLYSSSCVDS